MTCVVDWNNMCLVCLQKCENFCVFQKDTDSDLTIADKIMKCSDFLIKQCNPNDQPDNICRQCLNDLNVAFKFRQNCHQSNSIIKAVLGKDNHELEVSGLRIKIPAGLKVRKLEPPSDDINDQKIPLENTIKDEDEECKSSDDSEHFDLTECLDNMEVLEEHDGEEQTQGLDNTFEEMEKLEFIPELTELKPVRKYKKKNSFLETPKRGRGRPKKVFDRVPEVDYTEPGELIQRPKTENKPQKICEICGNSYKYQHALNSHMRRHRNERPFSCDFCEKAFVSAVELRRHMRVHTGQKPYECQYCERRFSDFGSRIKHERTHTGERPYICLTCGKSFAYAHVLTVHMRTHTGEKKYICSECGRGFTKKLYLDNHMSHHIVGSANEESSETATNIGEQYEDKMHVDRYVVLPIDKPKEEDCEEVIIQDTYHV